MMLSLILLVTLTMTGEVAPFASTPFRTTTVDPSMCEYNGRYYEDQEEIERDSNNCYGMYCDDGGVVAWDAACFFSTSRCAGHNIKVAGQCCPECIETTTPPTTPTTTEPPGCIVNGTYYPLDSVIPQDDPCKHCTCTKENGVMCAVAACGMVMCVNPIKKKDECCPRCPDGPNCWYGKRQIKVGDIYRPSPNVECACPDAWDPLACCRKLPSSASFLKKKLRRQGWYMNPMLKGYIETYLKSIGKK